MLVFRNSLWRSVPVILSDPIFTQGHKQEMAASIASQMDAGISLVSATAEAEKTLYMRLYGLVLRKEHSRPENEEKE